MNGKPRCTGKCFYSKAKIPAGSVRKCLKCLNPELPAEAEATEKPVEVKMEAPAEPKAPAKTEPDFDESSIFMDDLEEDDLPDDLFMGMGEM